MRFSKAMTTVVLLTGILGLVTGCLPDSTSSVNQRPSAELTVTPNSGAAPLEVTFNGSNSYDPDGIIISYKWDFGDGSLAKDKTSTHTYKLPGTYVVILEVTDDDGAINQTVSTILVFESSTPPIPDEPPPGVIRFEGHGSPLSRIPFTSEDSEIFFIDSCTAGIFDQHGGWVGFLEGGRKTIALAAGEIYYLDVAAGGVWAITILSRSHHPSPPQTYTGKGQELSQYTSLFTLDRGPVTFYIECVEGYHFSVVLLDSERDWVEVLQNTYESFADRVEVDVPGGVYLLKIYTSNDWEISVEQ